MIKSVIEMWKIEAGVRLHVVKLVRNFKMNEIDITDSEELDMTNFYYQFLKLERSVSDPNYSAASGVGLTKGRNDSNSELKQTIIYYVTGLLLINSLILQYNTDTQQ